MVLRVFRGGVSGRPPRAEHGQTAPERVAPAPEARGFFPCASSIDGATLRERAGGSGKPVYGTRADRGHAGHRDREDAQAQGRGGHRKHPRRDDVRCLAQAALVARQGRARIRAGPHPGSAHRRGGRRYFLLSLVLRHGHQRRAQRVPPPQIVAGATHREGFPAGSPLPTRSPASRGRARANAGSTARDGCVRKRLAFFARWREIFF